MLRELLSNKKSVIVDKWIQSIDNSYPLETSKFLKSQKDRFSNPVGYAISSCAENLFNELLKSCNKENIKASLLDLIKIRAVQEFSPSQSIGFIFQLKKIIHEELESEIKAGSNFRELMEIETVIDEMALAAFDLYMDAREKIFQIRVKELKARLLFNDMNGVPE